MEIIYGDASNINLTAQKRLLRVVQGQTQATPFSGYLDPSLRAGEGGTGAIRVPKKTDKTPTYPYAAERKEDAFTFEGSIVPGTVMVRTSEESFTVSAGNASERPFGLLGQWVGGTFDGLKSTNEIGVWQGPDSVYDVLAPAFYGGEKSAVEEETLAGETLSAALAKYNKRESVLPVYLYAGYDGRLSYRTPGTPTTEVGTLVAAEGKFHPVAEVIGLPSASVVRIRLLV